MTTTKTPKFTQVNLPTHNRSPLRATASSFMLRRFGGLVLREGHATRLQLLPAPAPEEILDDELRSWIETRQTEMARPAGGRPE